LFLSTIEVWRLVLQCLNEPLKVFIAERAIPLDALARAVSGAAASICAENSSGSSKKKRGNLVLNDRDWSYMHCDLLW
jgi:hypothetical protein